MARYEDRITMALQYLKNPSKTDARGASPIAYLVYEPEDVMTVRNLAETYLRPSAEYYGFAVESFSIGELLDKYIANHSYKEFWTDASVAESDVYDSIRQEIIDCEFFENALLEIQEGLKDEENALIVLQDVELLHPFYMMGVIENKIYNKIKRPIMVLYPGDTQGRARSFLSLYNQDGNYRSVNF